MFLDTVETAGLAHLSYVVGDERAGVCAVVDPRRDVDVYLDLAARRAARVTHVVETHVHADFVSGSRELAARTGAPICAGAGGGYGFEVRELGDGDEVALGAVVLRALHTPGHSPEHVCLAVRGGKGAEAPWGVFTGDTLLAGEVGRPDLLGDRAEAERHARDLYASLRDRLLPLGDHLSVYPAHAKGSPCAGAIGDRHATTIGYERLHSPHLRPVRDGDPAGFVRAVLDAAPPAPTYYARVKALNARGPAVLGAPLAVPALDPVAFAAAAAAPDAVVVDAREIDAWAAAHVPGSLNIALREEFPVWAGWMLRPEQQVLLVLPETGDGGADALAAVRGHLLRIGIERVGGSLQHGMRGWTEAGRDFARAGAIGVRELRARLDGERASHPAAGGAPAPQVLDVRDGQEWASGHVPGARHRFVPDVAAHAGELDRARPVAVYCGSGYRASIAASVLERAGFRDVATVLGSMAAWRAAGLPLEGA